MTTHIPKRIDINLVRARLGDKEAERLLMKLYAPSLMPNTKIKPEDYALTLNVLEHGTRGAGKGHAGQRIPMIFRQWFAERPRNAGIFKMWLRQQIALTAPPVELPVTPRAKAKKRKRAA